MKNALINSKKDKNIINEEDYNWTERMNAAIEYIESNLTSEIDLNITAGKAYCTEYHFTRVFSFITGYPLNEYIRNRRLTLAGFMLQRSNIKVIDIANMFGYTSPNSFTRAFYAMNGILPSKARDIDVNLKSYPRLDFSGKTQNNFKLEYRIVQEEEKIYFGKALTVKKSEAYKKIPEFWDKCENEEITNKIVELGNGNEKTLLKSVAWDTSNEIIKYMICLDVSKKLISRISDIIEENELETVVVPSGTWAVFPLKIENPNEDSIISVWNRIWSESFANSNYKFGSGPRQERCYWGDDGKMTVEAWVSVV